MSITSSTLALAFALAASLGACSSTVTGTGGTSGTSGTTPGGGTSRCVGTAIEAYKAGDRATCSLQGSDWSSTSLSCRGTTFVVNCARGDDHTRPDEAQKSGCLDILGCSWTEPDGTVVEPSGHCDGTKQKCSTFATDETCKQPGCIYYSSSGCEDLNGSQYLDNVDCGSLNFGPTLSVSVARSQCKRTLGCTWTE